MKKGSLIERQFGVYDILKIVRMILILTVV